MTTGFFLLLISFFIALGIVVYQVFVIKNLHFVIDHLEEMIETADYINDRHEQRTEDQEIYN